MNRQIWRSPVTGFALTVEVEEMRRYELIQTLKALNTDKEFCEGCLESRVFEELGNSYRILLMSLWENEASMQKYLESDRFHGIKGAAEVLGKIIRLQIFNESTGIV